LFLCANPSQTQRNATRKKDIQRQDSRKKEGMQKQITRVRKFKGSKYETRKWFQE
jgi:hypothetical protein